MNLKKNTRDTSDVCEGWDGAHIVITSRPSITINCQTFDDMVGFFRANNSNKINILHKNKV